MEIEPIIDAAPQIPEQLRHILLRCLEKKKDSSYQSASALYEDLVAFKKELKITFDSSDLADFMTKTFKEAINRKGFRFIEIITPCTTSYARLNRLGTGFDLMRFYHDNAEIRHGADTRDVDIDFQGRIICGKFVDEERSTFLDNMHNHYKATIGDKYVPTPPEGGLIRE